MAKDKTGKIAHEMTSDKFGTSMANCGTFHSRRGPDVELSEGNTVALIGGVQNFVPPHIVHGPPATIDMRRIVFSSEPIGVTGTFQVNVTRRRFISRNGFSFTFEPGDKSKQKICGYHNPHQTMVSFSCTDRNSRSPSN